MEREKKRKEVNAKAQLERAQADMGKIIDIEV